MAVIKRIESQTENETIETKPEEEQVEVVTEEKRGFFGTVWHYATAPARWVGRKLKESPAAAVIGGVGGAGLALGTKALYDHFTNKKGEVEIETDFVDNNDAAADSDMDEAV